MSEEKPLPCAFCGVHPFADDGAWVTYSHFCDKSPFRFNGCLTDWNDLQPLWIAQRRKDYEAGWGQGFCKGNNFDYRTIDTKSDFGNYIMREQHGDK